MQKRTDTTSRTGYRLSGAPATYSAIDKAVEYYNFDWEYAQSPDQSSWIATAGNYNATFDSYVGFGGNDKMSIDQRGEPLAFDLLYFSAGLILISFMVVMQKRRL